MRVLLMAYGSRGDIAPPAGLAARLRSRGAEVRVCAPPDEEFAELPAGVGAELVPFGRDVRALRTVAPPSDAAGFVLGPWRHSTDLDLVQTGAWILPDARPLPADLEAFLDAGTPPVYVGFGSMPLSAAGEIARTSVKAVRAQGRRVLVSRGWADLGLVDDADDCFAVGDVNHQALFGRVAAVVHHGGAGTTTTAARAGAPQVVVPQFVDQPHWAARVADLGIGAAHDGPTPTFESLSDALRTALDPETGARAKAVADTIRTDGTTVAANLLLDMKEPRQ